MQTLESRHQKPKTYFCPEHSHSPHHPLHPPKTKKYQPEIKQKLLRSSSHRADIKRRKGSKRRSKPSEIRPEIETIALERFGTIYHYHFDILNSMELIILQCVQSKIKHFQFSKICTRNLQFWKKFLHFGESIFLCFDHNFILQNVIDI